MQHPAVRLSIGDILRSLSNNELFDLCIGHNWDVFYGRPSYGPKPGICSQAIEALHISPALDPQDKGYEDSLEQTREDLIEGAPTTDALQLAIAKIEGRLRRMDQMRNKIISCIEDLQPLVVEAISEHIMDMNKKVHQLRRG